MLKLLEENTANTLCDMDVRRVFLNKVSFAQKFSAIGHWIIDLNVKLEMVKQLGDSKGSIL